MKTEPLRAVYGNTGMSLAIVILTCILQTNTGLSGLSAMQPKSKFRLTRRGVFRRRIQGPSAFDVVFQHFLDHARSDVSILDLDEMLEYGGRSAGNRVRKGVSASDYYSAAFRASPAKVVPNHLFRSRGQNHNGSPYPEAPQDQLVVEPVFRWNECTSQLSGTLGVVAGCCHYQGLLGVVCIHERLDITEAGDALNYLGLIGQEFTHQEFTLGCLIPLRLAERIMDHFGLIGQESNLEDLLSSECSVHEIDGQLFLSFPASGTGAAGLDRLQRLDR